MSIDLEQLIIQSYANTTLVYGIGVSLVLRF
jgi:hypothetical protein